MSDDELIDVIEPEQPAKDVAVVKTPKSGIGFGTALFMSLLAAGAGTFGGATLSKYWASDAQPANLSSVSQTLSGLEDENQKLRTELKRLENDIKTINVSPGPTDLTPLETRLSALEDRPAVALNDGSLDPDILARLESVATQDQSVDMSAIEVRLTELEKKEPSSRIQGGEIDPAIISRLEKLETMENETVDLTSIEQRLETLEAIEIPKVDLSPIDARINAVEQLAKNNPQLTQLKTQLSNVHQQFDVLEKRAALVAFPREAVLTAIAAQKEKEPSGWFDRALGKHITVQDEDVLTILDQIDAKFEANDLAAASAVVADLPEAGRVAAQKWVTQVEAIIGETP